MKTLWLAIAALLLSPTVVAEQYNTQRAHFNYQLFCQGCHTPDGVGATNIPRMKDYIGNFLLTEAGREYLVRVPGSATSALNDNELAEVLNWIVSNFAGDSGDREFRRYTAVEVGQLRKNPLNEVEQHRRQLVAEITSMQAEN